MSSTTSNQSTPEMTSPETGSSSISSKSVNLFFAGVTYSKPRNELGHLTQTQSLAMENREEDPMTPTSVQRNLCLNATSNLDVNLTDDEIDSPLASAVRKSRAASNCGRQNSALVPAVQEKAKEICVCASMNKPEGEATPKEDVEVPVVPAVVNAFPLKTTPITDEYKITHEIIGIGESGKVMACFSKKTGEKYALKVLRDGPRSRREVHLHYLTNTHENIVSIMDIFENTFDSVKCLLVVVEFLEGGDLLTRFESQGRNPYNERHVAKIIEQLANAVLYLHEMNIAHRDIKLENILCSSFDLENCVYKLADFGFAKRPERNNLMESPCCTPAYVCPEILSHERYDKSCDMWAIGVVMYILLCGYPPFYSMKGLPFSPGMKDRITVGLYAFPSEDWDHINQATKNEIRHLLRTDPHSRTTIQQLIAGQFLNPNPLRQTLPVVFSDSSLSSLDDYASCKSSPLVSEVASSSPDSAIGLSGGECLSDDSDSDKTSIAENIESKGKPKFILGAKSCREKKLWNNSRTQHPALPPHAMSARFLRPLPTTRPVTKANEARRSSNLEATRLYSIQEEVGRALDLMRLGGDSVYMKSLKVASGNKLLERRKAATNAAVANVAL